jgi:hypothetical protein
MKNFPTIKIDDRDGGPQEFLQGKTLWEILQLSSHEVKEWSSSGDFIGRNDAAIEAIHRLERESHKKKETFLGYRVSNYGVSIILSVD